MNIECKGIDKELSDLKIIYIDILRISFFLGKKLSLSFEFSIYIIIFLVVNFISLFSNKFFLKFGVVIVFDKYC